MNHKDTILIIGKSDDVINARREIRKIRGALEPVSEHVRVHAPDDPEAHDIVTELRAKNPTVIHLVSHGKLDGEGVPFFTVADVDGQPREMSLAKLLEHLERRAEEDTRRLKCVFMNACMVGEWASNFRSVADVVVGTTASLPETTAQLFATKFYEHIARQCSVHTAFSDAIAALELEDKRGVDSILITSNPASLAKQTFIGQPPQGAPEPPPAGALRSKWDVFISFTKEDSEKVFQLANNLLYLEVNSFTDSIKDSRYGVGNNWIKGASEAIDESGCGVIVISKASMSDRWVIEQYTALLDKAVGEGRRLIPLMIEDADLPPFLRNRVGCDFRDKKGEAYVEELHRLRRGILNIRKKTTITGLDIPT